MRGGPRLYAITSPDEIREAHEPTGKRFYTVATLEDRLTGERVFLAELPTSEDRYEWEDMAAAAIRAAGYEALDDWSEWEGGEIATTVTKLR